MGRLKSRWCGSSTAHKAVKLCIKTGIDYPHQNRPDLYLCRKMKEFMWNLQHDLYASLCLDKTLISKKWVRLSQQTLSKFAQLLSSSFLFIISKIKTVNRATHLNRYKSINKRNELSRVHTHFGKNKSRQ